MLLDCGSCNDEEIPQFGSHSLAYLNHHGKERRVPDVCPFICLQLESPFFLILGLSHYDFYIFYISKTKHDNNTEVHLIEVLCFKRVKIK